MNMANGTTIQMQMSDGAEIGVYHCEPQGTRRGGVVVVQEIFGVTDHIRTVCDDYAAEGYEVLAPALFDREEPDFEVGHDQLARAIELARDRHPFTLSLADVQSCIDKLAERGPVFVVGYCYGGSIAWFAATRLNGVAAASGYYGSLIPGDRQGKPKVPVQLHFGRHDETIPIAAVEGLIEANPPNCEIFVYEAGHGFNSDRRSEYDAESARLARARTLELFAANGVH